MRVRACVCVSIVWYTNKYRLHVCWVLFSNLNMNTEIILSRFLVCCRLWILFLFVVVFFFASLTILRDVIVRLHFSWIDISAASKNFLFIFSNGKLCSRFRLWFFAAKTMFFCRCRLSSVSIVDHYRWCQQTLLFTVLYYIPYMHDSNTNMVRQDW